MGKQKPYYEVEATKAKMLHNIAAILDMGDEVVEPTLWQKCCSLTSFYRNPPPPTHQYHWNHLWVMGCGFNQLYTKLQKLLWEGIDVAKTPATKLKRRLEAASLTIEIWENGHHFDEETGLVKIVPVPAPKPPLTPEQVALRRASIEATWRNKSRNS